MSDCEETKRNCQSVFLDGSAETTVARYTAAWVRMINLLEKSKNDATKSSEEN